MEELYKKIQELNDLLKQVKTQRPAPMPSIPPIKPIAPPSISAAPKATKIPGHSPGSNKDPKKVAEQLKNAKMQKLKMPLLKFDHNGQWKLES